MVKILTRQSLGKARVYDLGLAGDHNFILDNGCVASNCFNKSHSTAYAYVTYQTAYLKANYPVEYMAALLSESSGNSDKVKIYIDTCTRMGIAVEPPDINRSELDFTPVGGSILFGLSAVKNVGKGAIEGILKAREEAGGTFESIGDLCERVDIHTVKRPALETLIACGAFDKLNPNRKQMLQNLDLAIAWAQNRAKDRESGQTNIFDQLDAMASGTNKSFDRAPTAPAVEDFTRQEKLNREKELLGFYVSEHPLSSLQTANQILAPASILHLSEQPKRTLISVVAMVTSVKTITTKKGDRMAFVQIEDSTGATEAIVFPKIYEQVKDALFVDARLIVWGKVESKEDNKVQLLVEDLEPIEKVQMVAVELTPAQVPSVGQKLKTILQSYNGDKNARKVPAIGIICSGRDRQLIRFGPQYWVQDRQGAIAALKNAGFAVREEYVVPQKTP